MEKEHFLETFLKIYFCILAALGLHCCAGFSLAAVNRGYSGVAVGGLLTAVASLASRHRL